MQQSFYVECAIEYVRQNCAELKPQKISVACIVEHQRASAQTSKKTIFSKFFYQFFVCFHFKLTIDACSMFFHLSKVLGVIETNVLAIFIVVLLLFLD